MEHPNPDLYNDSYPDYASAPTISTVPPPHHPELLRRNRGSEKRPAWDHSEQPAAQKAKGEYSSFAKKMMEKSGWKEGAGLGREQQGIAEPIEASENMGRAGLGFTPTEKPLPRKKHSIDIYRDIPHRQEVRWISCPTPFDPSFDWSAGLQLSPQINYDYDQWCTRDLVAKLFERKDVFNNVPDREFRNARHSANPYETIGKAIFCNRAAVKMANLDHLFDLCAARDEKGYLVFADICAGPGGFTECTYFESDIMWRKKGFARGWGFTLVGQNDFQLNKFHPDAPTATFTPYYGVDKTGNIYLTENIRAFAAEVAKATGNKGVALVTADGGFNVDGEENFQEVKVRQLVMCQCLTALTLLKQGGDFVCKLFDVFTPFTVELLYILYCHFDKFTLLKPYSSRPANSERYVCCKGLKMRSPPVIEYLFKVNDMFNAKLSNGDILHLCDANRVQSDTAFSSFVKNHNVKAIAEQIEAIDHLIMYMEDPELLPVHQTGVRRRCLQEWNLPDDRAMQRGPLNSVAAESTALSSFASQDDPNKRKVNPGKLVTTKKPKEEEKFELTADKLAAIAKYKATTPAAKPLALTASAAKPAAASAGAPPMRKAPSARKTAH